MYTYSCLTLLAVWCTSHTFLLQALLLRELMYQMQLADKPLVLRIRYRIVCQIGEETLQDRKAVSHQCYFAPLDVWGTCPCCRAALGLLPPNMTWCTSVIPHDIISYYYYLIHRHWVIPADTHLPSYFSSASSLLPDQVSKPQAVSSSQAGTSGLAPYRNET